MKVFLNFSDKKGEIIHREINLSGEQRKTFLEALKNNKSIIFQFPHGILIEKGD
jgi:hypothetical protein